MYELKLLPNDSIENKVENILTFMNLIILGMNQILLENSKAFNIHQYVSLWDYDNEGNICGTQCCIEGWLPRIFPNEVYWIQRNYGNPFVVTKDSNDFSPDLIGIPLLIDKWMDLTIANRMVDKEKGIENFPKEANWEEVREFWYKIMKDIKRYPLRYTY